jgi:hypothetical protein
VSRHTGWRYIGDGWDPAHLHAGGALGGGGPVTDVAVKLPPALAPAEQVPSDDRDQCLAAGSHPAERR